MTGKQDSIVVDGVEWFVGDKVKVVQKVDSRHPTGHCGKLWTNSWVGAMSVKIGDTPVIAGFDGSDGIKMLDSSYWYPSSSLQNISAEQREAEKKAKEQAVNTKKDSIMVDGVEWRVGDHVVLAEDGDECKYVYSISAFVGGGALAIDSPSHRYSGAFDLFVNISAIGRERQRAKASPTAPTIGGIELKPWMRVETICGKGVVCHNICGERFAEYVLCYGERNGFDFLSSPDELPEFLAVYAAPDFPTTDPHEHGTLLWSKAGEEAKKEAEAKKKEAMTALEAAEVEFEAAKERYNEAYAKLTAITN